LITMVASLVDQSVDHVVDQAMKEQS
jgi:hypothetical protein